MQALPIPVTLRPATAEDAAAIAAIYAVHVLGSSATFEIEPPPAAEMAQRIAAVQEVGLPWWVAEHDGRLAGYAYAGSYRPRPAYRHTCEDSVYLAPWAMGRGLGRALLGRIIDEARAAGRSQMIAVIGGGNENPASIALHERLGFRQVGTFERVGFKFGRWLDTVLMQRGL
jgi:L-amino acid N-acyltransferase YncA